MTTTTSVSFDLGPGERLLWSGVPRQGVVFRNTDVVLVPFSMMWGGFALFWETMALRRAPLFFALWGVPFVVIGLYITIGRFFYDSFRRGHTFYGLTTERIIIAGGLQARTVKSLSLGTLTNVELDEHANSTGTISLGPRIGPGTWQRQAIWPGTQLAPSFEMIPDAKRVFGLIGDARRDDARAASTPSAAAR
jgi:hypothetical protein